MIYILQIDRKWKRLESGFTSLSSCFFGLLNKKVHVKFSQNSKVKPSYNNIQKQNSFEYNKNVYYVV